MSRLLLGTRQLPLGIQNQKGCSNMRRITTNLLVGLAITAISMFAADSLLGTWKLNAAKSKSTSSNPVTSQTDVRVEAPDGGVKLTRTGQLKDGTAFNYSFTFKYDGKKYPVSGGPFDTISVKRTGDNSTAFEGSKTGSKFHITGTTVVSSDGKTRTQTSKGTDADGKPLAETLVFDKQ